MSVLLTISFAACGAEDTLTETGNQQLQASQDTTRSTEADSTDSTGDVTVLTQTEPTTQPNATEPPVTEPAVTEPPETESPATEPPTAEHLVTEPFSSESTTVKYIQGNGYKRIKNSDETIATGPFCMHWGQGDMGTVYAAEYIFELDPMTISYAVWQTWDSRAKAAFNITYTVGDMTPEERNNYYRATHHEEYQCSFSNYVCQTADIHQYLMDMIARGCPFCYRHEECPTFYAVDPYTLFMDIDRTLCPEYDIYRDSNYYCQ